MSSPAVGLGERRRGVWGDPSALPYIFLSEGAWDSSVNPYAELSADWGVASAVAALFWISLTSFKKIRIFPTLIKTLAEVLSLSVCVPEH